MLTIHLNKLIFHAYHGLYDEERIVGNDFEVHVTLKQFAVADHINSIEQTSNYVAVYDLIRERMNTPIALLETLAQDICKQILSQFLLVDEVEIHITKLHLPIKQFIGSVGISFVLKR